MEYTLTELVWLFFLYSLIGWCGEVCVAAFQQRKFINRGFVNSPFCPIYGFAAVLSAIFLPELADSPFFLFLGGMVLCTLLEYLTGLSLEKIFHEKLWDYSKMRFHLDGYICVSCSLLWGILTVVTMLVLNPLLCRILHLIPALIAVPALWFLSGVLFLDFLGTSLAVLGMQKQAKHFHPLTSSIKQTSRMLENALTRKIQSRIYRSFPAIDLNSLAEKQAERAKAKSGAQPEIFAQGCCFYKLFCLFMIGAFLGDITETIFCCFTMGKLMSRSSVVYGPFSIVWGLGCAMLTLLLYRYKDKSDGYIFTAGTILGGAYEYICSVFTELVFGTIFWDYSGFAFNLGGRINLLYCFFWGIAAVVWLKLIYPGLSSLIEKFPVRPATILCNILAVFMVFNMLISGMALARYTERNTQPQDTEALLDYTFPETVNHFLDIHFTDERMERIYPNAKIVP